MFRAIVQDGQVMWRTIHCECGVGGSRAQAKGVGKYSFSATQDVHLQVDVFSQDAMGERYTMFQRAVSGKEVKSAWAHVLPRILGHSMMSSHRSGRSQAKVSRREERLR